MISIYIYLSQTTNVADSSELNPRVLRIYKLAFRQCGDTDILAVFQVLIFPMQKAVQIVRQLFEHNAALLCQRLGIACRDLVHNHPIYSHVSLTR